MSDTPKTHDLEELLDNGAVEFVVLAPEMVEWSEHDRELVHRVISAILKENRIVPRLEHE